MKKIIATALIVLTVLCCFTACKNNEEDSTSDDIKVIDFSTTRTPVETTLPKSDKTVKINVPSILVEGNAKGDLEQYAATYDYKIKEESDGTVTMKMDGMTYSLLLSNIGMDVMMSLGEIVDSGEYPYVVKLHDYSKDFSYILMQVDTEKYKKNNGGMSYEDLAFFIGQFGLYYQYFTVEDDDKCEVVLASSKTGKVVFREVYTNESNS